MEAMRALIVEDNENSRVLLQNVLEDAGFEVRGVGNGKEALALLGRGFVPQIFVSDILMPEMDGYSLCKILKKDPRYEKIPFVFYTATYTDAKDRELALDLGADAFFVKPMDMKGLVSKLKQLINGSVPVGSLRKKDSDIEKMYSGVLARKLDKKIHDLEVERAKLQQSENKYRRLVEALRDNYFFYTLDDGGRLTYVSPSVIFVLGYSAEEFLAHFEDIFSLSRQREKMKKKVALALEGKKQGPYEVRVSHKSGEERVLELTELPVIDDQGRVTSIDGIAHDVTRQKQMARQLRQSQKMEALGTLAGGIAHDFNNILTAIQGNAELIRIQQQRGHTADDQIEAILQACKRASELVQQILRFSRSTDEEQRIIDPVKVIDEGIKMLRSTLPATVNIVEDIDRDCGKVVMDPTNLHQVLINLCTNGIQAMSDNKGTLRIGLYRTSTLPPSALDSTSRTGPWIILTVTDTGCGMDRATRERIFEPYFTTKKMGEGTGLGLAVVHGIVKNAGGTIWVDSKEDKGTTFSVYLPLARQEEQNLSRIVSAATDGSLNSLAGKSVMIVDDEPFLVRLHEDQLHHCGCKTISFTDPKAALEALRQHPDDVDLLITDQMMPGLTGEELADAAKKIRPDLPVLICSGYGIRGIRERKASADCRTDAVYLGKPFEMQELMAAAQKALQSTKDS